MPPPGYEPFLRAICASPEDDTVRLVYADWLDENNDPERAEFIRLQMAEKNGPESDRTQILREKRSPEWRAELPRVGGVDPGEFRRGFVDELKFKTFKFFRKRLEQFLAATPATNLRISQLLALDLPFILNSPHAKKIIELDIRAGRLGDEVLVRLADSNCMVRLEVLSVNGSAGPGCGITDRGLLALLHSTTLKHLRSARLFGAAYSRAVWEQFQHRFGNDGRLS